MKPSSTLLSYVALAGLVVLGYGNSLLNEFALDDHPIIAQNPRIQSLENVVWFFGTDYWATIGDPREGHPDPASELYRPFTLATYAFNYALGGLNPVGYHAVNVLLHFLVSCSLFWVGRQLALSRTASLLAAGLFAAHPIHTEAVTNVVGRAELLMALGTLSTLCLAASGHQRAALATFAMSIFSKEQGVVALLLLPLYAYVRGPLSMPQAVSENDPGARGGEWFRYWGFVAILGVYLALRLSVLHGMRPVTTGPIENPIATVDWVTRSLTAIKAAGLYLWLCLWPATLSADYSYNAIPVVTSWTEPGVLWGLVSWGLLLWLALRSCFGADRRACFSIGVTLLSFLPTSNLFFPIGTIMGERLFYLPSAGLCLLVGLAFERPLTFILSPVGGEGRVRGTVARRAALVALLFLACTALIVRTAIRNQDWRNDEALERSGIRDMPTSVKNHVGLTYMLVKQNTPESRRQAMAELEIITGILKDYSKKEPGAANDLAQIYMTVGQWEPAIQVYKDALSRHPAWANAEYNLGLALILVGRPQEAEPHLRKAIEQKDDERDYYNVLSHVLIKQQRFDEALQAADKAIRLSPTFAAAHYYRSQALEGLGQTAEAAQARARSEQLER